MKNSKISNIYSAHNHPTEKPIPHKEIRESCCINCGNEMKIGDFITYTILHNKKVLWWHRRKSVNESDPCPKIKIKIDKRSSVIQRNVIWKDK